MPTKASEPPATDEGGSGNRPKAPLAAVGAIVISAVTGLIHVVLALVAQRFAKVFEGFGIEPPLLTQVFMPGSAIYFILPLLCVFAWAARWLNIGVSRPIFMICFFASMLLVPVFFVAMTLPTFEGAAVVE